MSFENLFDFWIANKVLFLYNEGYTLCQAKKLMQLMYSDFCDIVDDKNVLQEIKNKIELTLELFYMKGMKNEQTN